MQFIVSLPIFTVFLLRVFNSLCNIGEQHFIYVIGIITGKKFDEYCIQIIKEVICQLLPLVLNIHFDLLREILLFLDPLVNLKQGSASALVLVLEGCEPLPSVSLNCCL